MQGPRWQCGHGGSPGVPSRTGGFVPNGAVKEWLYKLQFTFINVVFMCRFTWEQGGLTLPWRSLWGLGSGWPDWSVFRLSHALLGSEAEVYMRVLLFQPPKEAF